MITETGNHTRQWLEEMQSLSLFEKEILTAQRIKEAIVASKGKCYVAFSGGKDSSCLLYQVAKEWKDCIKLSLIQDIPLNVIFANTGNEYLAILAFVTPFCEYIESTFGITINLHKVTPMYNDKPTNYINVVKEIGYPIASKRTSRMIRVVRKDFIQLGYSRSETMKFINNLNTLSETDAFDLLNKNGFSKTATLYLTGINSKGNACYSWKLAKKWKPLIYAPFKCSEQCCDILKKEPQKKYAKENGLDLAFIGEMAADGENRELVYLKTGCNAFDGDGKGKSKPMGFWLEQDVLEYIYANKIPIAKCYGELHRNKQTGKLKFTNMDRTGCKLCLFGVQMNRGDERITELYRFEPKIVNWVLQPKPQGLGYKKVLKYLEKECNCKVKLPDNAEK